MLSMQLRKPKIRPPVMMAGISGAKISASSIYDYIENTLVMQIITSKRRMTVEHATARDEKLLDMGTYGCVVVVMNQTFNAAGLLFEYTQSRHQPDYFYFQDIATRKK